MATVRSQLRAATKIIGCTKATSLKFWARFTERERQDEIAVLQRLAPAVSLMKGKLWLLSVVLKQDLWWPDRAAVEDYYRCGAYHEAIQPIVQKTDPKQFRHELLFMSVVISNLKTSSGETLQENAKGYDQHQQAESQRRLFEVVDSLRRWEEGK